MDKKIKQKVDKIKSLTGKKFTTNRKKFITWARSQRYTYEEIGSWFGLTRARIWSIDKE